MSDNNIKRVTWGKDASLTYSSNGSGYELIDTHEYDDVLYVFVEYENGETKDWSADWGRSGVPDWASDAIDWAIES